MVNFNLTDQTSLANRALQRVGSQRIAPGALLTENSKPAQEIAACYDSLRLVELRRNVWRFAIRRVPLRAIDATTFLLVPQLFDFTATYGTNSIVSYNGRIWISTLYANKGNAPDMNVGWTQYFGPMTVTPYDSGTTYYAGELVYSPSNTGYEVFISLLNDNSGAPNTTPVYDPTATYGLGDTVSYSAANWTSNKILNLNNTPGADPALWLIGTTYALNATVVASDNQIYTSQANGNVGHNPVTDDGTHWLQTGEPNWVVAPVDLALVNLSLWQNIEATLAPITIIYPIGTGPLTQETTKNVYMLPNGYLREAPQEPKLGQSSWMGFPSNLPMTDWIFEGNYLISMDSGPLLFRFVADVNDVTMFDPLFYEGFAARIAYEVCETLTQSNSKLQAIGGAYKAFMKEARDVNGIEQGVTESPLDDFIATRA